LPTLAIHSNACKRAAGFAREKMKPAARFSRIVFEDQLNFSWREEPMRILIALCLGLFLSSPGFSGEADVQGAQACH
jgi:hypothetical protein